MVEAEDLEEAEEAANRRMDMTSKCCFSFKQNNEKVATVSQQTLHQCTA